MEYYILNLYDSFQCLAGACPSTCCSGWEIEVAKEDFKRFQMLEPVWLRKEILEHIREKNGKYVFRNRENGTCSMLEKDGLCLIERHTSEKTLCNTCRKYPRIYHVSDDMAAFSMAASCPVVARGIIENTLKLLKKTSGGERKEVSYTEIPFCKEVFSVHENNLKKEKYAERRNMTELLFLIQSGDAKGEIFLSILSVFEKFADIVSDILLTENTPLKSEILELLSYYEMEKTTEEMLADLTKFYLKNNQLFSGISISYFPYRVYSRWLEYPEESFFENDIQVCGELFFFYFFSFLESWKEREGDRKVWEKMICFSYRFFAHGSRIGNILHKEFCRMAELTF